MGATIQAQVNSCFDQKAQQLLSKSAVGAGWPTTMLPGLILGLLLAADSNHISTLYVNCLPASWADDCGCCYPAALDETAEALGIANSARGRCCKLQYGGQKHCCT
jgi:hypothetical protein